MVNLCNDGTKDFVELWKIIHLKIWTQLTYSIIVKPVQTTTPADNHSSKTTNAESVHVFIRQPPY